MSVTPELIENVGCVLLYMDIIGTPDLTVYTGEGNVVLYATPNPYLLNKIFLKMYTLVSKSSGAICLLEQKVYYSHARLLLYRWPNL